MRRSSISDVEFFIVGRKTKTVWFKNFIGHLLDFKRLTINPINRLFLIGLFRRIRSFFALVVHQTSIARISKPDISIWMDCSIVGGIQRFPIVFVCKYGQRSIVFVPNHSSVTMFERDLPPLIIERVSVTVSSRITKCLPPAIASGCCWECRSTTDIYRLHSTRGLPPTACLGCDKFFEWAYFPTHIF